MLIYRENYNSIKSLIYFFFTLCMYFNFIFFKNKFFFSLTSLFFFKINYINKYQNSNFFKINKNKQIKKLNQKIKYNLNKSS